MLFLFFILLKCLDSHCSDLRVILSEPKVQPQDYWGVEILDSALNNYEEFTICGRVKNYNFKRSSSSSVWETILASDDAQYLHVFLAIDCEDIYNACTNHYKHYIGKTYFTSHQPLALISLNEQELTSGREEDPWDIYDMEKQSSSSQFGG